MTSTEKQEGPAQGCTCSEFTPTTTIQCGSCHLPTAKTEPPDSSSVETARRARASAIGAQVADAVSRLAYEAMRACDLPRCADDYEYFYGDGAKVPTAEVMADTVRRVEKAVGDAIRAGLAPETEASERREAMRRRATQRRHVLEELISTEEEYVKDLGTIDTLWRAGLEKTGLLTPATAASLFGTIPQLAFLSTELLREMQAVAQKPLPEQRLGEVLLKKVPFMRLYIEFCSEQAKQIELIETFSHDPVFEAFQDEAMKNPASKHLDLAGFLIKPTQRITKYPLLLRDIIKFTEKEHLDYQKLVQADARLRGVLDEVNEKTKLQESVDLFSTVQPKLRWTNKAYDLVASRCIVICHGNIRWEIVCPVISPEPLARGNYIFVINHFILACNERAKNFVELSTFLIHSICIPEQDPSGNDIELHVSRTDGVSMSLVIHPNDFLERQTWFTAVKTCREKAPEKPAQLVDLSAQRRTVDGTGNFTKATVPAVPQIAIPPRDSSEGAATQPIAGSPMGLSTPEERKAYLKAGKTRMSLMEMLSSRISPSSTSPVSARREATPELMRPEPLSAKEKEKKKPSHKRTHSYLPKRKSSAPEEDHPSPSPPPSESPTPDSPAQASWQAADVSIVELPTEGDPVETPPSSHKHRKRKPVLGKSKEAPAELNPRPRSNDILIGPPEVLDEPQGAAISRSKTSEPVQEVTAAAAATPSQEKK